ncbi:MAG TPA: proline/glycine betaine ABC transporter permease [Spirochaetota bacterium]|nr:proline/glycine betaine ABC transporter permease [Spirochaetota bacterium]HPJ41630.1 proline/glycine betaine ABC transporter permease [Spirochaetota bacterium]HPR36698.1 proline/glycine betaine ABC transporter permease [Spirochaetota bacterium]HRX47110.1 proline/glycine betaine ABC transporter permease [Spirochaetota bacterium]
MTMIIPKLPLDVAVDTFIDYTTKNFSFITKAISSVMKVGIDSVNEFLMFIPPAVLIILFVALAWYFSTRGIAIFTALGLLFIWNLGLWSASISTLTLVIISTFLSILAGIPLGILAALNTRARRVIMPILDFMQTMPAFVYLIPAIPFFGLGVVSAVFTTVIFSMPPAIRLTCLGIQQVPEQFIEAADSFGATKKQKLFQIQLPLATPTIMAGINQTIMLALSMVVIAAMIGAGGLGGEVWRAIQRLRPGMGFEAGLAVVIMAIILDRITQNLRKKNE